MKTATADSDELSRARREVRLAGRAVEGRPAIKEEGPTLEEIKRWPAAVTVERAGNAFGLSRSFSYELLSRNEFPARALKCGGTWRVLTSSIIEALGG